MGLLSFLYWYYLYCYICTRKFTSSPQELVHFHLPVMFTKPLILQEATDLRLWSIECAFAAHQIQTMNKMFDIIYQLWYFQIFFLMNCIFPICCLRSKLYLKVLLLQQLWCNNYYKYNWLIEKMEIMVWRNWVLLKIHRFKHFKQCCFCFNCSNTFFIYISMCISVFKWFTLNANALK